MHSQIAEERILLAKLLSPARKQGSKVFGAYLAPTGDCGVLVLGQVGGESIKAELALNYYSWVDGVKQRRLSCNMGLWGTVKKVTSSSARGHCWSAVDIRLSYTCTVYPTNSNYDPCSCLDGPGRRVRTQPHAPFIWVRISRGAVQQTVISAVRIWYLV